MVSARVRREQVAFLETRGLSRRRACALLAVARSTVGYQSRLVAKDAPVVKAMQTLAGQYPRAGYRTVMIFLARQAHVLCADRAYRQPAARCPVAGRAAAWRRAARGHSPRRRSITSGPTTSCSIPAPTAGR